MADQNPKDINTVNNITRIDANDYLLVSDQGSALRKVNSNVVSKYALETYNGTSLGGSNKTVQAAINDLNSEFVYYTDANSASDGNTISDRYKASIIRILTTFSATNPTANKPYTLMAVLTGTSAATMVGTLSVTSTAIRGVLSYNSDSYSFTFTRSNSTMSTWILMPTRAEIDTLNSKTTPEVLFQGETSITTANTEVSFSKTVDNYSLLHLTLNSVEGNPTSSRSSCFVLVGDVAYIPIQVGQTIQRLRVNVATNKITFIGTSASSLYICRIMRV